MKAAITAVIAVLAVISATAQPGLAVDCGEVNAALAPCIIYLTGLEGSPSPVCCDGVRAVKGMAQTTAEKRACCGCIKAAANRYADLKDEAAQRMPAKCGVQLDIPVSRSVDCDKIV